MEFEELTVRLSALGYYRVSTEERDFSLFLRDEPFHRKALVLGASGDSFTEWRRFLAESVLPYRTDRSGFSVSVLLPEGEKVSPYLIELPWIESIWVKSERGLRSVRSHPRWGVEERFLLTFFSGRAEEVEEVELYPQSPVTYLFLLANGVMFLIATLMGGSRNEEVLIRLGAKFTPRIWMGEPWRLLTPVFLHAGFMHFLLNSYALYQLGRAVDRLFGRYRLVLIYLSGGLLGSAASVIFRPDAISVGASGAIFGLLGALIYFNLIKPRTARRFFGRTLWTVLALNLFLGFIPGIDFFGHLGGFGGGILAAAAVGLGRKDPLPRRRSFVALFLLILPGIIWLSLIPPKTNWYQPLEEGRTALHRDEVETAIARLEESFRLKPNPLTEEYLIRAYSAGIAKYYKAGELEKAASGYRRLITLEDDWRYHFDLGYIYYLQGKYGEARKEFEIVLERKPKHEETRRLLRQIREMGY